ncbi:hypothetical protein PIB30_084121, partial [Stylosanthes scabra]|nr:hypothetical protein [Stylosanthes scabra]
NQGKYIKNVETQVNQLAKQLATKSPNTFPSDTIVNPKGECKVITLRSVKELEDNFGPKLEQQAEDKTVEDSSVMSSTEESAKVKPTTTPSSSSSSKKEVQIPFPHRLRKE